MAAALSAMRRAIMDMASLADLVLLGMGSGSIDHRYPGQLQRPPIINRPASSRIRPVGIRRWGDYRRGPPAIRSHDRSARRHLATDSPLEEAVSSEPVSDPKFSASWENAGNFVDC